MNDVKHPEQLESTCQVFEAGWKAGQRPRLEQFLGDHFPLQRQELLTELIQIELWWRRHESPPAERLEFERRFPEFPQAIATAFQRYDEPSHIQENSANAGAAAFAFLDDSGISGPEFRDRLAHSGLMPDDQVQQVFEGLAESDRSAVGLAAALASQSKLTPGQARLLAKDQQVPLVIGGYRIEDKLGEGGMGQVFRAVHQKMKREVALKIISPQIVGDASSVQRFNREVEAAARLTHPNIVTAHDAGEIENVHYLVMEYVVGLDLMAIVRRKGCLPVANAVDCTLQAARGLTYAHDAGIVHRDIKPSNLLVDTSGTVKILDMGLARLEANQEEAVLQGLTHTGMVMGTVDYMAPEQAFDSKTADARSDIYSLGCTMYFLMAGHTMYPGDTVVQRLLAHREHPVPDLPDSTKQDVDSDVWGRLNETFQRMVAKAPEERFVTMRKVVESLEAIRNDLGEAEPTIHVGYSETNLGPPVEMERTSVLKFAEMDTHSSARQEGTVTLDEPPRRQSAPAPPVPKTSNDRQPPRNRKLLALAAGGLAVVLLLTILTFKFRGPDGVVVVELEDAVDIASVEVDGNEVAFTPGGSDNRLRFHADPGRHELTLKSSDGLELTTSLGPKPLQIQAGDTTKVRAWLEETKEPEASLPVPEAKLASAGSPTGNHLPRVEYDPSPLEELGTWEPGPPAEPWPLLKQGDDYPGVLEEPAELAGVDRWNVDTFWPRGKVYEAEYGPRGEWLALGSADGHIRLYDTATYTQCRLLPGSGFQYGVRHMAWSPDGSRIAGLDGRGALRVWQVDGTLAAETRIQGDANNIAWLDDKTMIASINYPDHRDDEAWLVFFDREAKQVRRLVNADLKPVYGNLSVSPGGKKVVCHHGDGKVRVWDLESGDVLGELGEVHHNFESLAWSQADWIAIATGKEIRIHRPDGTQEQTVPFGGVAPVWDDTGTKLLSATAPPRIWDVETAAFVAPQNTEKFDREWGDNGTPQYTEALDWSPDGRKVVRAVARLEIFDAALEQRQYVSPQFTFHPRAASWSPDGKRLVTSSDLRTSHVWSWNGKLLRSTDSGLYCHWMPDSTTIVSAQGNRLHFVTEESTHYREIPELSAVGWLSPNPDGSLIAACANDREGEQVLAILGADGMLVRQIPIPPADDSMNLTHNRSLSWSAENGLILLEEDWKVFTVNPSSNWKLQEIGEGTGQCDAVWNPGGTLISAKHRYRLDGTKVPGDYGGPGVWSPDGNAFFQYQHGAVVRSHADVLRDRPLNLSGGDPARCSWNPARASIFMNDWHSRIVALDATDLLPHWHGLLLPENHAATFTAAGQVLDADPEVLEKYVVYYVETEEGQVETLTPSEFEARIGQSIYAPGAGAP